MESLGVQHAELLHRQLVLATAAGYFPTFQQPDRFIPLSNLQLWAAGHRGLALPLRR
jgi:hypothetical protein